MIQVVTSRARRTRAQRDVTDYFFVAASAAVPIDFIERSRGWSRARPENPSPFARLPPTLEEPYPARCTEAQSGARTRRESQRVTPTPDIERAAAALRQGKLVAFPTETVYGLGADAENVAAVSRIFAVKGRPADHPLIVHIASFHELPRWAAQVPKAAQRLAEACWPGPLTLLLPKAAAVPGVTTGGRDSIGLRVPAHPVALALLRS